MRPAALGRAFDQLADFEAVQSGRSFDEFVEAVDNLQLAVGISDAERVLIRDRLEARGSPTGTRGPVLMGLIVGLLASELGDD